MMLSRLEVRSQPEIKGNKLGGYAAVFNETADLGSSKGQERMAPGSLDRAMRISDTRALYNHSMLHVLGRKSAGTLRMSTDSNGLEYEIDLPNTTYANDLRELVERGDITGASFGFVPDKYNYEQRYEAIVHTEVADLVDVSPVTFPAYSGATTEVRSQLLVVGRRTSQLIRARARVHLGG